VSRHDTDDGTVEWHEISRSIHTPLDRIAAEKPWLLRVLTDRVVHESAHENRAVTTHFGSTS
jgi:hypothetical protein